MQHELGMAANPVAVVMTCSHARHALKLTLGVETTQSSKHLISHLFPGLNVFSIFQPLQASVHHGVSIAERAQLSTS